MIITRKQPDLKFEISKEEALRVFDAVLNDYCGEYHVEGKKLLEEVTTSHRFDMEILRHELGDRYDVVFAACKLRGLIQAHLALKALKK